MPKFIGNIATACGKLNMLKRAVNATMRGVQGGPDYAHAILQAKSYERNGMYKEAVRAYKLAVQAKPRDSRAYCNLGNACSRLGRFGEAITAYKEAVRLNPNDADAYYSLAQAYSKAGNYNAAVSTTKRAIQIRPAMSEAHNSLGIFYGKLKMYREARQSLAEAVKAEPANTSAHYNLAVVCMKMNDRDFAMEEYKILKELSPRTADKLLKRL